MNTALQNWLADLRFAARSLRRSPGFATTAIFSLAIGVALTTSTLTVMNSYLIRAMPYPAADRLYRVLYDNSREPEPQRLEQVDWNSLKDIVEVADSSTLARYILHAENYPQEIFALLCAPGCADALGVQTTVGRTLTEADFQPGSERVVLISHALWVERFGSDPHALGKTLHVSAANSGDTPTEYRIVGVLPEGFRYVGNYLRAKGAGSSRSKPIMFANCDPCSSA